MHYRQKARTEKRYTSANLYRTATKQYNDANLQGFPFNHFEFVEIFEPAYCKSSLISLYFDIYEYTGGAHGNTVRQGNTWDMKKGTMISLESLFERNYDYKSNILIYIEAEAKRRQNTESANYFEELSGNIIKYFNQDNYYLTYEGLAIFYPLYTIAPYSEGIQVFVIPYRLFGDELIYDL